MRLSLAVVALSVAGANKAFAAETMTPISAATSTGQSWVALLVPVYVAVIGALVALYTLYAQRRDKASADQEVARTDQRQRQRELALKVVESITKEGQTGDKDNDAEVIRGTMARRFAIGLIKVEGAGVIFDASIDNSNITTIKLENDINVKGKVFFIPIVTRITLGRDASNDIHLSDQKLGDDNRLLSRHHCGFVATDKYVSLEDYYSANGTLVACADGKETLKIVDQGEVKEVRVTRIESAQQRLNDRDLILAGPFLLRFLKLEPTW